MSDPGTNSEDDPFNLERFVHAQKNAYQQALVEISQGQKNSHWMWFIFPQAKGLGRSYQSEFYGIGSLDEARGYLSHKTLGPRLIECVSALLSVQGRTAIEIFGPTDEMKLRSSLTLFNIASDEPMFCQALYKYFNGLPDVKTLEILERGD